MDAVEKLRIPRFRGVFVRDNYLKNSIFYNTEQIQPKGELFCGHLCLYVLKQLSLGKYLQEILNNLH